MYVCACLGCMYVSGSYSAPSLSLSSFTSSFVLSLQEVDEWMSGSSMRKMWRGEGCISVELGSGVYVVSGSYGVD